MKMPARQTGLAICSFLAGFLACYLWLRSHQAAVPLDSRENRGLVDATNRQRMRALERSTPPAHADPQPDRNSVAEEVVGIGAAIHFDRQTGTLRIMDIVPNSPAARAGLSAGLIIRKIDDAVATGMKLQECVNLIRGPLGTKVRLDVLDPSRNEIITVELTRQKLQL